MNAMFGIAPGVLLLFGTASCLTQAPPDEQQELATHLQKAQGYIRDKRPDLAIPELQTAVGIDPGNVETQGNLGVLLYFQARPTDAIPHLRAAVEKQPSLVKIQGVLGIAELQTQDFADARKDLESSFPQIPDRKFKSQVGLELVGLYTRDGELTEAARVVGELRKSDIDNAEVLYAAYRTYSDLAGESMLALALRASDSAQMHQAIAHEQTRQGNTNGAIAQYRKAIVIEPHLPGVHFELAELLNTSADPNMKKEAEQEYRTALADYPQDEKAELRLGEIDAQRGDTKRAYEEFLKAAALQPSDADAKLGLAKTLIELNQSDKALALLEETVQLEPTNAVAHYRLGTLYRKLGRAEDAKREADLYKQYKDLKGKLREVYKVLLIQPKEITADDRDEK
jgi:cytochrome c-type biogenesis protein CcmH/NrfG